MRTIICNSLQSFWDMADNQFLEGLDVHCVFPVNDAINSNTKYAACRLPMPLHNVHKRRPSHKLGLLVLFSKPMY
ncbi:TPA: hypothetical protein ACN30O_001604 [Vibrio parahaemolyticus]